MFTFNTNNRTTTTNNTETIVELGEDDESLELLDMKNNGEARKTSGSTTRGGSSGSSRGRRGSIFSVFSNFHINHRPSCLSCLSEISQSFSTGSLYDWNYRRLFMVILAVALLSAIIMYFFLIFVPNSYLSKFTDKGHFDFNL